MHALCKTRPLFLILSPFFIEERLIVCSAYELGDQPVHPVHFLLVYMYIFFPHQPVPCLSFSVWVLYEKKGLVTRTCYIVFVICNFTW